MNDRHTSTLDASLAGALLDRLKEADPESQKVDLDRIRHFSARGQTRYLREALQYLIGVSDSTSATRRNLEAELNSLPQEEQPQEKPLTALPATLPTQLVTIPDPLPKTQQITLQPLGKSPWPVPPLFAANWQEMSEGELTTAIVCAPACFPEIFPADDFTVARAGRSAQLPHYPEFTAVELFLSNAEGEGFSHLGVYGKGKALLINGASNGIHEFNAEQLAEENQPANQPLDLRSSDQAKSYLRFFCGCVHAEDGPFSIIETAEQLQARWTESTVPDETLNQITPLTVTVDKNETTDTENLTWNAKATVLYSNSLFAAQFIIRSSGMVEMPDDESIATELPILRDGFLRNFRIAGDNSTEPK